MRRKRGGGLVGVEVENGTRLCRLRRSGVFPLPSLARWERMVHLRLWAVGWLAIRPWWGMYDGGIKRLLFTVGVDFLVDEEKI